ncbi:8949_t:CDS:2, partial [Funneliformis geosporum]
VNKHSDNEVEEVEGYNWHNKISDALKNLELDIKKEKVNNYHITELREQPKELKQVLIEKGLWPNEGLKLKEA